MGQSALEMLSNRAALFRLLAGLSLGLSAGLLYGWLVQPVEYVDTTPESLREDFKVEIILMVAEAYPEKGDLDWVRQHLALLGPLDQLELVRRAETYARQHDYRNEDVARLNQLKQALLAEGGQPQIGGP